MRKQNQNTMQSEIFIVLMIFAILLFISVFQTLEKIQEEKKELEKKLMEYKVIKKDYKKIKKLLHQLKENQQPPLIVLKEAEGYAFSSNSATLSQGFKKQLNLSIVEKIKQFSLEYNCDIVEIYGYTDGEPFGSSHGTANFDKALHQCLIEGCDISSIHSSSNLELGMQRAVSVVEFIHSKLLLDEHIEIVRAYSAGQFIDANGKIADLNDTSKESSRRRIEIKLSRSPELLQRILEKEE